MSFLASLKGYFQGKRPDSLNAPARGTGNAFENMSQLATRPTGGDNPRDKTSFTNLELYQYYEWYRIVHRGIDRLVNSAYASNMEPPIKPEILQMLVKKDITKRLIGWTVVYKQPNGEVVHLAPYHDKLMTGVKPTPIKMADDNQTVVEGGIDPKTGWPRTFDMYVDGTPIKRLETGSFIVCTNNTIHHTWRGTIEALPVLADVVLVDKMVEMYANFCVVNALGVITAACKDPQGKAAFDAAFSKPSSLRAWSYLKEFIDEIDYVGPQGSTFDPIDMIRDLKNEISEHFSLDKVAGAGTSPEAMASESDYYSKVVEFQMQTLPENIKILELYGSIDEVMPDYPGMERKREQYSSFDQFRFPDPRESTTAQMMTQVNMLVQMGAMAGVDPETIINEICNITNWSIEFSQEIYNNMTAAEPGADNETNRAMGDAKPNVDNKTKANNPESSKVSTNE